MNSHTKKKKEPKVGVIITNLGSPDAPTKKAVKKYLKQFLWDPRVIQPLLPRWVWWCILNGIILNTRPKKSAKLYAEIWDKDSNQSPLIKISYQQLEKIKVQLTSTNVVGVELAMRYGQPSLNLACDNLIQQGAESILVLPLYPQYSQTTTESCFDVLNELQQKKTIPSFLAINNYHDNPDYIQALKNSVLRYWSEFGQPQKLIISFHGIPKVYYETGDVYPDQCYKTAELLIKSLDLKSDQVLVCFQSRFGKLEWMKPYLDKTLAKLPAQGIKDVQVICPGFAADCLETLEEIEGENKDIFLEAGGEKYGYIPALNDNEEHISLLVKLINSQL